MKLHGINNLQMNFISKSSENLNKERFIHHLKKVFGEVNLADMQLINIRKYNKVIRFLLCAIDLVSKYAWVILIKDKKGVSIVCNAFQKILDN